MHMKAIGQSWFAMAMRNLTPRDISLPPGPALVVTLTLVMEGSGHGF